MLDQGKLIELRKTVGLSATELGIAKNPKSLQFKVLEVTELPRVWDDVDITVINYNYAFYG